jgi:transcriptional regulator with XRE-family HTH domain
VPDPWNAQLEALGAFIRNQRKLAHLSLRQLAEMTTLSNPYLSQVERGLHQPSVRVLKLISEALNVSAETLLAQAGLLSGADDDGTASAAAPSADQVEAAIRADTRLSEAQKTALMTVYDSMLGG